MEWDVDESLLSPSLSEEEVEFELEVEVEEAVSVPVFWTQMEFSLTPLPLTFTLAVVTAGFPAVVLLASAKLLESVVVHEPVLAAAVTLETDGSHAPLSFEEGLNAHIGICSTASANPRPVDVYEEHPEDQSSSVRIEAFFHWQYVHAAIRLYETELHKQAELLSVGAL